VSNEPDYIALARVDLDHSCSLMLCVPTVICITKSCCYSCSTTCKNHVFRQYLNYQLKEEQQPGHELYASYKLVCKTYVKIVNWN